MPDVDSPPTPTGPAVPSVLRRRTAHVRPLALYEQVETLSSLMWAARPSLRTSSRMVTAAPELWRWRHSPAGLVVSGARTAPDSVAVVDDGRVLTFRELDRRTNAIARWWTAQGVDGSSVIGLLLRNRASFLEAMMAAHKLGADLVFLNTAFAAPQVADVVATHAIDVLVHDADLADAAADSSPRLRQTDRDLGAAADEGDGSPVAAPAATGRVVVLTSGTTGRPKGAVRAGGKAADVAPILTCIPVMSGDTAVVAAPLFHGLGLFMASLSLSLRSAVVLDPDFDAERTLARVAEHRAAVLVVVPVMLQRIMALSDRQRARYDTTSLRVILSGGAALPGELARQVMDHFGDVLFNVYGSTEVAMATVAGPRDLRSAPGTAGRPVPGVTVRVLDDAGRAVAPGTTGRVFVDSGLRFDGYVGGGGKEVVDGLVSTGDMGRIDRSGRLEVEGRDDEMIISGGENLFPAEVEGVLFAHPEVEEAAVVGVTDPEFGQRLRAFIVRRPGSAVTAADLQAHVKASLARFKVPREVLFLPDLPRGSTGKVLKRMLQDPEWVATIETTAEARR